MDNYKILNHFPKGAVTIPSSKSVAHRAILCAAMAEGESILHNMQLSDDITVTLSAVTALGAQYICDNGSYKVRGGLSHGGECSIDCHESGSSLRFLVPISAALNKKASFAGRGRLMQRPMSPYIDLGIVNSNGEVQGRLSGGKYKMPGNISSQFITGLLLALPLTNAGGEIEIEGNLESASYVDLTMEVMRNFGVSIKQDGFGFVLESNQCYHPAEYTVEADYSQAAFFLVAGALGYPVQCLGLRANSLQGDRAVIEILKQCGAEISIGQNGGLIAAADQSQLKPITVDVSNIPDLVPVLAVLLSFCEGESLIVNAARLRLKESDRLSSIASELNKLGGKIEAGEDYLRITGVKSLRGGTVDSWNDHRIAMAMAVASLRCEGEVKLSGWEAVAKSYPNFWNDFEKEERVL